MYNFGVPSQLKAWIDRISVAGKTFSYGEHGPVGLCGGKKLVIASSRGGVYSEGSPTAFFDPSAGFLRHSQEGTPFSFTATRSASS